jgi:hypothetical protein
MIGELRCMPTYHKDIDRAEVPEAVAALRVAAAESDAALVISPMYGTRSPALRNAIDSLTQPGNGELHDKPGPAQLFRSDVKDVYLEVHGEVIIQIDREWLVIQPPLWA